MSEDAVSNKRAVGILGVPLDLGAGRRGTDMGPSALRIAGMAARIENVGRIVEDHGYVAVAAPETRTPGDERLRFGKEILRTCMRVRDRVKAILTGGAFPLVIGGDHSMAMGTVAGTKAWANGPIGVLWIDAHAEDAIALLGLTGFYVYFLVLHNCSFIALTFIYLKGLIKFNIFFNFFHCQMITGF